MPSGSTETEVVIHGPSRLRFTYRSLTPEVYSIVPRLRLDIDVHHVVSPPQPAHTISLRFSNSEFRILSSEGTPIYSGSLSPSQTSYSLSPGSSTPAQLFLDLDHYRLNQIERLRAGRDVSYQAELRFEAEILIPQQLPIRRVEKTVLDSRIAKSDWVEEILPKLGWKDVALVEIPKITKPEFSGIIGRIEEAWRQYSLGAYDNVLAECRKAVEGLASLVKDKGFVREIEEEGEKKKVPSWEEAVGHRETGNVVGTIVQKLFGFTAPGAHYGKSINREDAQLAILCTIGLVNFVAEKS